MIRLTFFRTGAAASTVLFAAGAAAQDTYTLGDDDTWSVTETLDPATPEGQIAIARRTLAQGSAERAYDLADDWIDRHEGHPMLPLAYLVRGDAMTALGDEHEALFDYEAIARLYPGSEVFVTALQRELEIAKKYARGYKRKLWGMRIVDATDVGEELLIRVQERLPGSNLAEEAGMELGDFYFREGEMFMATEAYDLFLANYPDSADLTKARRRLIAAHLASFKGPEWDASGLYSARVRIAEMKLVDPTEAQKMGADAILAGINERDAEKMLTTARWYLRIDDPIAAEYEIRRLVRKYPNTAAAAEALRSIDEVLTLLSQNLQDEVRPFYADASEKALGIAAAAAEGAAGGDG